MDIIQIVSSRSLYSISIRPWSFNHPSRGASSTGFRQHGNKRFAWNAHLNYSYNNLLVNVVSKSVHLIPDISQDFQLNQQIIMSQNAAKANLNTKARC